MFDHGLTEILELLEGAILSFNNRNLNFNPLSTKISNKKYRFIGILNVTYCFRTNFLFQLPANMETNEKPVSICETSAGNDAKSTNDLTSQSHAHINRIKKEDLRTTKSFELHHTRSFSEIRHLHPSSTDVSFGITYPKPRNIEALQERVKRPESILDISDLSVQEGEDDMEEDITEAQERGDKAMKLFLESNISVPLDGTMSSSSSSSFESLHSDLASEQELIVGTWKNDARGLLSNT